MMGSGSLKLIHAIMKLIQAMKKLINAVIKLHHDSHILHCDSHNCIVLINNSLNIPQRHRLH